MTATTTTVAALRGHLFDLLAADSALAGVLVTYEEQSDPARETVTLDPEVEYDGEFHTMKSGRKRRDGTYSFDVMFSAVSSQAQRTNEERVVAMVAALEDIIADDPGLAGSVPGVLWVRLAEMTMKTEKDSDGFAGTELRVRVEVKELLQ